MGDSKMYKRTALDYFYLWLKGMGMGTANKIPGVSGGMIALVFVFYEELIYSFQKINANAWRLLINGRFKKFWQYINGDFLFFINFGSVSAYFTISFLLDFMMRSKAEKGLGLNFEVWAFFFGLIIGSIIYVSKRIKQWEWKTILSVFLGTALGLWLSFIDPLPPNDALWFCFFCGFLSVSGMALPGFSGSFLLIIIGNYNLLLVDAVNNLFFTITAILGGDWENLGTTNIYDYQDRIKLIKIVAVFGVGSFIGLISFSKIMSYLLKRFHNIVLAVLIGFIAGSLGAAWPWKIELVKNDRIVGYERFIPEVNFDFLTQVVSIFLGVAAILLIDYFESKRIKKR